ncbi:Putative protein TIC 214 N-terminal part [Frankliniella fusca]|uniref:Uncharacterized protein n=1 Tax=Frankliniella fusca TaxID=407009 RepID=A0AAE1HAP0_9NEOP|nr:Putative protein TIC 214 N-terminal part [Frankliniella fusca]
MIGLCAAFMCRFSFSLQPICGILGTAILQFCAGHLIVSTLSESCLSVFDLFKLLPACCFGSILLTACLSFN